MTTVRTDHDQIGTDLRSVSPNFGRRPAVKYGNAVWRNSETSNPLAHVAGDVLGDGFFHLPQRPGCGKRGAIHPAYATHDRRNDRADLKARRPARIERSSGLENLVRLVGCVNRDQNVFVAH